METATIALWLTIAVLLIIGSFLVVWWSYRAGTERDKAAMLDRLKDLGNSMAGKPSRRELDRWGEHNARAITTLREEVALVMENRLAAISSDIATVAELARTALTTAASPTQKGMLAEPVSDESTHIMDRENLPLYVEPMGSEYGGDADRDEVTPTKLSRIGLGVTRASDADELALRGNAAPLDITREKARELARLFHDPAYPEHTPLMAEAIYISARDRGGLVTLDEIAKVAAELQKKWDGRS